MKQLDALKAVGLALLILALNLLVATAAITVYALATSPGRAVVVDVRALHVADWSAPIGGACLFFLAAWVLGRRRPQRNAVAFSALVWVAYAILDVGSGAAMGDGRAMLSPLMAASLGVALLGAVAGGLLARTRTAPTQNATTVSEIAS
ncbi:hypothetical protein [Phenylobacterium sp.]|jgi:hypothetical protein|uniref:hypothetical protein n=1 Tax=Phenylobacterium sp. TaxID=1871053 RepID=UPI002F4271DC